MNRFLLLTLLIFISGCASDFGFQSQSQNVVSMREFDFKSGISGTIPPGLCQIKQLQSESVGQGVVFFSNCNPHTNNKSLVTLTYLDLGQTEREGLFNEDELIIHLLVFKNLMACIQCLMKSFCVSRELKKIIFLWQIIMFPKVEIYLISDQRLT